MKKILSISLVCFFLTLTASAQDKVIEVLSVKGIVKWKKSSVGDPYELRVYQRLLPDDQIVILDNKSSVRFINNKTKYVAELSKPGKYRVSSFLNDTSWHNDLRKFVDLILEDVKPESGGSKYVVCGITRGQRGYFYPPDSTRILQNEINFKWNSRNEPQQHFFIEKDSKYLINMVLSDASLTLSTQSDIINQPGKYTWKAYSNDEKIDPACFIILSNNDKENLRKAIAEKKLHRTGDDVFDLLELAKFYKLNNLFIEADNTYEQILKLIQ